jgi:spectinomycin phosphotransferase
VRSPPPDLPPAALAEALRSGWGIEAVATEYVPEGGGSHHWRVTDARGGPHFVTVDDLSAKDWLGDRADQVFDGLARALATATALRDRAGLDFVLAPRPDIVGTAVRRLGPGFAVAVYPFVAGRAHPFGPYRDPALRDAAVDLLARLHGATGAVADGAPGHTLSSTGRDDLDAVLADPARPWTGGPFSASARALVTARREELAALVAAFDRLAERTAPARQAAPVLIHGEPHPANLLSAEDGRLLLIDWDTAGLGPPERDAALVVGADGAGAGRYRRATGRALDPAVLLLYRARWYLDDLGSAVRLFTRPHRRTADTERWARALGPQLDELPRWRTALSHP